MIERYILVSDEEYVYTLDTFSKDYKTLGDFEKEEIEIAKKEGVDIDEYVEEILLKAHDKYWEWVYEYHMEADEVNDMLNILYEEKEQLKKIKTLYKGQKDYLLFVIERECSKNLFNTVKSNLMDVEDLE